MTCSAAAMTVLLNEWAFYQPQATKYQADASLGRDTYSWPLLLLIQLWAKRVHQQFSFIGDDALDSPLCGAQHVIAIIHRPYKEAASSLAHLGNQVLVHQRFVRNYILDRQSRPAGLLNALFTNNTKRDGGATRFQLQNNIGGDGGDHVIALRTVVAQCRAS